jgi:hypothetical protein
LRCGTRCLPRVGEPASYRLKRLLKG